jgi:hypothetical protein
MKTIKYVFLFVMFLTGLFACKEGGRFEFASDDSVPPESPVFRKYKPLNGGARLFYDVPKDEDLLSINAEFTVANGQLAWFAVSYYVDSLDVYGMADTAVQTVQLYAMDRAGNKSPVTAVPVKPLESMISKVLKSIEVKPAFGSFFVNWTNELKQSVNVYIDFSFNDNGTQRSYTRVYSSTKDSMRVFITDLEMVSPQDPIAVKVHVEDLYGNVSETVDAGQIFLYEDFLIPKDRWLLPASVDSVGGVRMVDGNRMEGLNARVIDGIINIDESAQYLNTSGSYSHQTSPFKGWNFMIDLGDKYELSRILTHQRRYGDSPTPYTKGALYTIYNVAVYNLYIMDDETEEWEFVSQIKIPVPTGMMDADIIRMGIAGDMNYMFPDAPKFTKPTRWLRYEALKGFGSNYTSTDVYCLAEITLYGRKAE